MRYSDFNYREFMIERRIEWKTVQNLAKLHSIAKYAILAVRSLMDFEQRLKEDDVFDCAMCDTAYGSMAYAAVLAGMFPDDAPEISAGDDEDDHHILREHNRILDERQKVHESAFQPESEDNLRWIRRHSFLETWEDEINEAIGDVVELGDIASNSYHFAAIRGLLRLQSLYSVVSEIRADEDPDATDKRILKEYATEWEHTKVLKQCRLIAARLVPEYRQLCMLFFGAVPLSPPSTTVYPLVTATTATPKELTAGDVVESATQRLRTSYAAFLSGRAAIVHFSTGIFGQEKNAEVVPLNHVVAYYRINGTPESKVFDVQTYHTDSPDEQGAILQCLRFFEHHEEMKIVVWRNEHCYGFNHLVRRLAFLKKETPRTPPATTRILDLNQHLQDAYGENYASRERGRMLDCFELNGITAANYLPTLEETQKAYEERNFEKLRMNSLAKCKSIAAVLKLAAEGTLKVRNEPLPKPEQSTATALPQSLPDVANHSEEAKRKIPPTFQDSQRLTAIIVIDKLNEKNKPMTAPLIAKAIGNPDLAGQGQFKTLLSALVKSESLKSDMRWGTDRGYGLGTWPTAMPKGT
jgi:hypothetical protein